MGFPTWTLWGMGLSAAGALIAIGLSLLAQTPRLLARFGLTKFRFDLRARSFTVYGFALLLLGIGFFLAGVPLGDTPVAESPLELAEGGPSVEETAAVTEELSEELNPLSTLQPATPSDPIEEEAADNATTSSTGAFGGLPDQETAAEETAAPTIPAELLGTEVADGSLSSTLSLTTTAAITATNGLAATDAPLEANVTDEPPAPTAEPPTPTPTETPSPTSTDTPSPTPAPTEEPTSTPIPTPSPMPPDQPTANIGVGTSTLWVRRTPGGQNLSLLRSGDTVLLLSGHANYNGLLWRQVSTLDGVVGWVQTAYLDINETSQATQ